MFLFTRAALRSSASANYMSIAATAAALKGPTTVRISFDYRNCGLTAAPPQLRGVSTATAGGAHRNGIAHPGTGRTPVLHPCNHSSGDNRDCRFRNIVALREQKASDVCMARHPILLFGLRINQVGIVIQIPDALPFGHVQPNRDCGP